MQRYLTIFIAAFAGFAISSYIRHKKNRREKLICFLGRDCNKVIYSRYASTFGIPNEIAGMIFYGSTAAIFAAFFINPDFAAPFIFLAIKIATTFAAIFFVYLLFVQLFILKEWCEWCLSSAILAFVIFALVNGIV